MQSERDGPPQRVANGRLQVGDVLEAWKKASGGHTRDAAAGFCRSAVLSCCLNAQAAERAPDQTGPDPSVWERAFGDRRSEACGRSHNRETGRSDTAGDGDRGGGGSKEWP